MPFAPFVTTFILMLSLLSKSGVRSRSWRMSLARLVAVDLRGPHPIIELEISSMISQDFAYMLEAVPGCHFMLGNGNAELQPMLDSPDYDFNGELRVRAAAMLGRLNELFLANA